MTTERLSPAQAPLGALYAAGFVTAFGANGIAAGVGAEHGNVGLTLLTLGLFLAVYDIAEVILKPVFGALSDKIGPKQVIVAGLIGFGIASAAGIWASGPIALGVIRFLQGASASAFSPSSSAAVARLTSPARRGRYFGRYGSWKGLGYALGPVLGALLIHTAGTGLLFAVLAALSAVTAAAVALRVPTIPPAPRTRATLRDLAREITHRNFFAPTFALATATAALGTLTGLLPAFARTLGLGVIAATSAVTVLAIVSAIVQPIAGRFRDSGRLTSRSGTVGGLMFIVLGLVAPAVVPTPVTVFLAAILVGAGIGVVTPVAFAHLSASTSPDRMGRTMGSAELGREAGDAAGPLIVGTVAASAGLPAGLLVLAAVAVVSAGTALTLRPPAKETGAERIST